MPTGHLHRRMLSQSSGETLLDFAQSTGAAYYWPCQETSGTNVEEVLQGADGTTQANCSTGAAGIYGTGYALNNTAKTGGGFHAPGVQYIDNTGGGWTWSMIFTAVSHTNGQEEGLMGNTFKPQIKGQGGASYSYFALRANGPDSSETPALTGSSSCTWKKSLSGDLADQQWEAITSTAYHLVWTVDWNDTFTTSNLIDVNVYMDNIAAVISSGSLKNYNGQTLNNLSTTFTAGNGNAASGYNFQGKLAHVMVWNDRALSAAQVDTLYNLLLAQA